VFAAANNAEMVCIFRQASGQLAVRELVIHDDLIHGKRQGLGELLDELSVLAFVGVLEEIAPHGIGYGSYVLIGAFNDVHAGSFFCPVA
jgi:hypothetical protein